MIQKAAEFAEKAHEGKFRKGTSVPYIVHPLETAAIVSGMTGDEEVICAALLHDVIEDAGVTYKELEKQFGARVAGLVQAESEDKTKSWQERKQTPVEVKMICLGDKLSNLRSTAADLLLKGESVWEKFREKDKRKHEWYYRSIYARLSGLEKETAYAEYGMLLQKIFGQ